MDSGMNMELKNDKTFTDENASINSAEVENSLGQLKNTGVGSNSKKCK